MALNSVSPATTTAASAQASTSGVASNSLDEAQSRFMKLLVTQMQNQDPLNPMSNADLTAQMAQLNTVSGINQLNTTMQSLLSNLQVSQSMQAASLIGRSVLVDSPAVSLQQGQAAMAVQLADAVDSLKLTIVNAAGQTVRSLDAGAQAAGLHNFAWDGLSDSGATAPDGTYSLQVQASSHGQVVTATPLAVGQVDSVSLAGGAVRLSTKSLGEVALTDVRQVR
jgi:flagellar basal-body rod modification protein FlgD